MVENRFHQWCKVHSINVLAKACFTNIVKSLAANRSIGLSLEVIEALLEEVGKPVDIEVVLA